jgi:hypothetical protein
MAKLMKKTKTKQKIKLSKLYILLSIVAIVLVCFSVWDWMCRPLNVITIDAEFIVGDHTGVNLDTDKLYFGMVVPGGSSERAAKIENTYDFPVKIKVFVTKNIADYIFLDRDFIAPPNNITKIPVAVYVPDDLPYGNYTGKIRFEFRKA